VVAVAGTTFLILLSTQEGLAAAVTEELQVWLRLLGQQILAVVVVGTVLLGRHTLAPVVPLRAALASSLSDTHFN
jgi:hypothetical protein